MKRSLKWMAVPALAAVFVIVVYPLVFAALFSLRDVRMNLAGRWVGLANYRTMLQDPEFSSAILTTGVFVVGSTFLSVVAGCALALALRQPFRGRGVVLAIVLMPWVFPVVVTATMARSLLNEYTGIISYTLLVTGVVDEPVLQDPGAVLLAAILTDVWRSTPLVAMFVLAGLYLIPHSVEESALVDGANVAQRLLRVKLPLLKPVLLVVLLFRTLDALRVFDLLYVLSGRDLVSLATYIYTNVLRSNLFIGLGMAASVSVYIVALLMAFMFAALLRVQDSVDNLETNEASRFSPLTRAGGVTNATSLVVVAIAISSFLVPLALVLKMSLSTPADLSTAPPSVLPRSFSPDYYLSLLSTPSFMRSLFNSTVIACSTVLVVMLLAAPAAYAIVRARPVGSRIFLAIVLAIAFFPQVAVLTPLLVQFGILNFADTYWAAIVPSTGFLLPLAIWFLVFFVREVPKEIEEAAMVDGASALQTLSRITLPLAAPGVLVTSSLIFVLVWNDFVFARTLILDDVKQPVTVLLGDFVAGINAPEAYGFAAAGAIVTTLLPAALIVACGGLLARKLLD